MLSFRTDESEVHDLRSWAERLGLAQSTMLRDALHYYLARLKSEHDAAIWEQSPSTEAEQSLALVADWGPAEDWADWDDATG